MLKRLSLLIATVYSTSCIAADPRGPHLLNPGQWLAKRDAPGSVLKRGERVLTWLSIEVSAAGLPINCAIKESSGHDSLDNYACNFFEKHGRFAPARDANGNAVSGIDEQYITWEANKTAIDADTSKASTAKAGSDAGMWVNTDDLPRGLLGQNEIVNSSIKLIISPTGRVTSCEVKIPSAKPDLDKRACALMIVRGNYKPARDFEGNPTEGVDWRRISWQIPKD